MLSDPPEKSPDHSPCLPRLLKVAAFLFPLFSFISSISFAAEVVISEVMFDPRYSDDYYEFVEICNISDSPVIMSGWKLGDGSSEDYIIDAGGGLTLAPGHYGLILDPDYFLQQPLYDYLIPGECLILTVESSTLGQQGLNNSVPENIVLSDADSAVIAEYTYSVGNTPGHSDEKILLSGGDSPSNWNDSLFPDGTPGFKNSVSPRDYNLSLISLSFSPLNPQNGDIVTLNALVKNTGLFPFSQFQAGFFLDLDSDSIFTAEEMFDLISHPGLAAGDSITLQTFTGSLSSGAYFFGARNLTGDEFPFDDTVAVWVSVGAQIGAVVFNEIMFKPQSSACEWLELFNRSDQPLELSGWRFTDSDTSGGVILQPYCLLPDSFLVIASDSSIFSFPGLTEEAAVQVLSFFPALNNTGDMLHLFDLTGNQVDFLAYPDGWGGVENGISMARIDPYSDAGLSNWLPSAEAEGGSPGRRNSVYFQSGVDDRLELSAAPEFFFPDGSGASETTTIHIKLPFPAGRINLRIFDVRGRLIRFLRKNWTVGSESDHIWDGRDDGNRIARLGPYIVHLEALSETYARKVEAKTVVVLGKKL